MTEPEPAAERPPSLGRDFFGRDAWIVAPDLLGCIVECGGVRLRLTEVEAYGGAVDPGSHAFHGRTARTEVMFGTPGLLYVYFTYGMHHCVNLVCGSEGMASAVLLRAGDVVAGADIALRRRTRPGRPAPIGRDLARGPARLAVALGLDRSHNGLDTTSREAALVVHPGPHLGEAAARSHRGAATMPRLAPERVSDRAGRIRRGPRTGVAGPGGDGQKYPWRFWLDGEPTVSPYRPAVPRIRG